MTTRERILKEALNLFSEKGYSDVYIGEIAEAVGIKAPSLMRSVYPKRIKSISGKLRFIAMST